MSFPSRSRKFNVLYRINILSFFLLLEKCTGQPEAGSCTNFIYKWHYDAATKECKTFVWGGCNGNPQNRFNTEAECLYHCVGEPRKYKPLLCLSSYAHFATHWITLISDTLSPLLQTSTRNHLITEEPISSTTISTVSDNPGDQGVPFELTFEENRQQKTFLFAQDNTFIQMDGDTIQTFQLR